MYVVHDIRQMVIHTAGPLVPETSLLEAENAIGKFESYKSPDIDQIPTELITAGGETLQSEIHRFIVVHRIRRNCQSSGGNLLLYQFIKRVVRLILIIIEGSVSLINCLQNFI
jgi:hypothetical protein